MRIRVRQRQQLGGSYQVIRLALVLMLAGASFCAAAVAAADEKRWILVDTRNLTLSVMENDTALYTYDNIAIGSNGATQNKRVSDEKTPLGDYRINEIRPSSRFHVFVSIDYPSMADARRALAQDRISAEEYEVLSSARRRGWPPPQTTVLGGHLGIHGIGAGSREIHENFNWTDGCIALTNEQLDELLPLISTGTRVTIR
jgi:murein L,D-transpeptidase YafK